jgi:hypothetical protein
MMAKKTSLPVAMAFEPRPITLPIASITPLRLVTKAIRNSVKFGRIAASIREVGVIEPPVIARDRNVAGKYLLLDGHLRLEVLKDLGVENVSCLLSTDDEAFTYNRRVNRLAIIQEHKMILKAIDRGVSDERIARALNIDVKTLRQKKRLLAGICAEAADLLRDKHVSMGAFWVLKRMSPLRQIEAAELMIAMNRYTCNYARSLLAATPQDQLIETDKPKTVKGLTSDQMALMERETANLEREFKLVEQSYGTDHLDFVLAKGFLAKMLRNAKVVRYLAQHHSGILAEFQKLAEMETAAAA